MPAILDQQGPNSSTDTNTLESSSGRHSQRSISDQEHSDTCLMTTNKTIITIQPKLWREMLKLPSYLHCIDSVRDQE